jgi:hypothetical protein
MISLHDVKELEIALHRKLVNINSDIRIQRKRKYPDKTILNILKEKSKCIDATLSACKQLYLHFDTQVDPDILYRSYNRLYRSI